MSKTVDIDSPAVQSYLTILQGVIGRMASNSAGAKTWCIALVSAIIVVVATGEKSGLVWVSLVPVGLFFLLDAYYLGLERQFRCRYNDFIGKLHDGKAQVKDVFIVTPSGDLTGSMRAAFRACGSVSVWPFLFPTCRHASGDPNLRSMALVFTRLRGRGFKSRRPD